MKTRLAFVAVLLGSLLLPPMAYCTETVSAGDPSTAMKSSVEGSDPVPANAQDSGPYSDGMRAIHDSRWSDAVAIFTKVAGEQGDHAEAALYWKAYAENKQGQSSRALNTCDELRHGHPKSRWIDECGALEIEIRAQSGMPMPPQAEQDTDLKLLALNSQMKQDELRALPALQQILNSDLPEKFKERALFLLAQGKSKPAQELLQQIARGHSNAALQTKAAEMLENRRDQQTGSDSIAIDDNHAPNIQSFVQEEAAEMPGNRDDAQKGASSLAEVKANRVLTFDVVVTDKSGRPVSGLQPQDFTLLDNKQARNIVSVRAVDGVTANADAPAEVFLLIDGINTPFNSIAYVRKELVEYLRQNGGHLAAPTSLIFVTDTRVQIQNRPTRDGNLLVANLDNNPIGLRIFGGSGGLYVAEARWELSLRALDSLATSAMSKRPGRKLVVWISPGWPGFSGLTFRSTWKNQQGLFDYIVGISTALRDARLTLCSVDPYGAGNPQAYYRSFLKGVTSVKQTDYADLLLQVLADQTGGQVLFGSHDLASLIDRCAADANAYYVLSFHPAPAAHPNEYHAIAVQVGKPGLKARTRTGYYAQP